MDFLDFLKKHVTDETFTALSDELKDKKDVVKLVNLKDGEYVSKSKFDTQFNTAATLTTQLEERATDISDLQKQLADTEGVDDLKGNLTDLQAKYDADTATNKANVKNLAASLFLVNEGVNPLYVMSIMPHIDMDKVTTGENGELQGIADQVTPLKKTHKLFWSEKNFQSTPPTPPTPPDPEDESQLSDEDFAKRRMEQRNKN